MAVVVDASVVAGLILPDEGDAASAFARRIFGAGDAVVPSLWWLEVCNLIIIGERRGRLPADAGRDAIPALRDFVIDEDRAPDYRSILALASRHGLTAYDATYLELAVRRQTPLATFDRALRRAAKNEGLSVIDA